MKVPLKNSQKVLCGCLAMMAMHSAALCQSGSSVPQKSSSLTAEAFAAAMWKKITIVCPTVEGSPSTFVLFPSDRFYLSGVVEIRGSWTKVVPITPTQADRLNGIQDQALALIGGTALRHSFSWEPTAIKWSPWKDGGRRSTPQTVKDLRFRDSYDVIAVVIERRDGQWFFTRQPWSKERSELSAIDPVPLSCLQLANSLPRN